MEYMHDHDGITIVVDLVERDKWIGFRRDIEEDFPIWIGREGKSWLCTGGISDEHRGKGSTPPVALRRMAKHAGIVGTALMRFEATTNEEIEIQLYATE